MLFRACGRRCVRLRRPVSVDPATIAGTFAHMIDTAVASEEAIRVRGELLRSRFRDRFPEAPPAFWREFARRSLGDCVGLDADDPIRALAIDDPERREQLGHDLWHFAHKPDRVG